MTIERIVDIRLTQKSVKPLVECSLNTW